MEVDGTKGRRMGWKLESWKKEEGEIWGRRGDIWIFSHEEKSKLLSPFRNSHTLVRISPGKSVLSTGLFRPAPSFLSASPDME